MIMLTKTEAFLLHWLSQEDFSSLGECEGRDLNELETLGLVKINDRRLGGYAAVSVTEAGFKLLSDMANQNKA